MDADLQEDIQVFKLYSGLFFTDDQIKNSLHQQVISIFRPSRFPVFQDDKWMQFVPITQLERIIYNNLKKHRPEPIQTNTKSTPIFVEGVKSVNFKRG